MSGVRLTRQIETWVEVHAECAACGMPVLSDVDGSEYRYEGRYEGRIQPTGHRLLVKVRPCARCAREAAEQKQQDNREG